MRVEITGRVNHLGVVKTSGIVDVPEVTGKHWVATGVAKIPVPEPVNPPASEPVPAAESGKKPRF